MDKAKEILGVVNHYLLHGDYPHLDKSEFNVIAQALQKFVAPEARYTKIGVLHRTSGRLTEGQSIVSFHQEAFSIPLAVHGTLDVYMLDNPLPQPHTPEKK